MYNYGSPKEEMLFWSSDTGISDLSTPIKSDGNQIYIEFTSDGSESEKAFFASILFGIRAES